MATEVLMPKLGLTMTEGTIEEWKFKEGDAVKKGDILFSVATDKLTNDVEAEEDGVLLKILLPEGETAPCKAVIGWIGAAGEAVPDAAGSAAPAAAPAAAAPAAAGSCRRSCRSRGCCRPEDRHRCRRRPRRLCGCHPCGSAGRQGDPGGA